MIPPDEGSPRAPAAASKTTGGFLATAPPPAAVLRHDHPKPMPFGLDEPSPAPMQRKSHASRSDASNEGLPPTQGPAAVPLRRSSNFSEYNLDEARHLLNPGAAAPATHAPESSSLASLSLAFALLPAVAGVLVKDGHVLVTDIMLLGLSGVFLHWSVTQPWVWYHSAQQVRVEQESDTALEEDLQSNGSCLDTTQQQQQQQQQPKTSLDHVPEEEEEEEEERGGGEDGHSPIEKDSSSHPEHPPDLITSLKRSALRELYAHEVLALLSCFLLPILSAYLLHHIRVQLSRPSEGLVSNYNLTIFLLVSELRAFSHTIKLVKSRTLHLQRVLHGGQDPFPAPGQPPVAAAAAATAHLEDVLERIGRLEARSLADEFVREHSQDDHITMMGCDPGGSAGSTLEQKTSLLRDIRNAIQPDLDALNRAVRRYEKKAVLLQHQTDARFAAIDSRLDDALALAAVAAKNSSSRNVLVRMTGSCIGLGLVPFRALLQLFTLPVRSILGVINARKRRGRGPGLGTGTGMGMGSHARGSRLGGKQQQQAFQPRYGVDRVSPRVMKR
ncbi:hypothetical protein E4U57_000149 [Claviceps arundinis]|uniref:Uncharacterized protein n=1 Tax=Claviceps arundinis TaxID=1623583 RepID=A0ABQ7PLY3_9HYPO|nr:hypothetical protein E4U57_000149 [Claviceps arundinis]